MDNQIRVLHIMSGVVLGGVSTVVLNYYQHIDRNKFKFDIAINTANLGPTVIDLRNLGQKYFISLKIKETPFTTAATGIIESGSTMLSAITVV